MNKIYLLDVETINAEYTAIVKDLTAEGYIFRGMKQTYKYILEPEEVIEEEIFNIEYIISNGGIEPAIYLNNEEIFISQEADIEISRLFSEPELDVYQTDRKFRVKRLLDILYYYLLKGYREDITYPYGEMTITISHNEPVEFMLTEGKNKRLNRLANLLNIPVYTIDSFKK